LRTSQTSHDTQATLSRHTVNGKIQLQYFIRVIHTHKTSPDSRQGQLQTPKTRNQQTRTRTHTVTNTEQTGYTHTHTHTHTLSLTH